VQDALVAAVRNCGPLDNEEAAAKASGRAPDLSICAVILANRVCWRRGRGAGSVSGWMRDRLVVR
jgi:hypothetical protein